jgi:DNA invertase Pin-like site-specific DNA recombinase
VQRAAIQAEAAHRGWELLCIIGEDAGASGKSLERPGVKRALAELDAGNADILLIAKLDRLTRSNLDGATVMAQAKAGGWSLVACDTSGIDMSTPVGEIVTTILVGMATFERRLIGERTKAALAEKKAAGVRLGPKRAVSEPIIQRILQERGQGRSLPAIAAGLEADGIPTARKGKRWYPSTIKAIIDLHALDAGRPADPRLSEDRALD